MQILAPSRTTIATNSYSVNRGLRLRPEKHRPPNRAHKSQEVLRQMAYETAIWGTLENPRSRARSAKPRVVRGSGRHLFADSDLEAHVLAARMNVNRRSITNFRLPNPPGIHLAW